MAVQMQVNGGAVNFVAGEGGPAEVLSPWGRFLEILRSKRISVEDLQPLPDWRFIYIVLMFQACHTLTDSVDRLGVCGRGGAICRHGQAGGTGQGGKAQQEATKSQRRSARAEVHGRN